MRRSLPLAVLTRRLKPMLNNLVNRLIKRISNMRLYIHRLTMAAAICGLSIFVFAQSGRKILIAHRGASAYAPEHTIEAYRLAIEQGADFVEQDLQITKDGELVCLHDLTLERTTDVEEVFPDRFRADRSEEHTS